MMLIVLSGLTKGANSFSCTSESFSYFFLVLQQSFLLHSSSLKHLKEYPEKNSLLLCVLLAMVILRYLTPLLSDFFTTISLPCGFGSMNLCLSVRIMFPYLFMPKHLSEMITFS
jgi:hypothetical protein